MLRIVSALRTWEADGALPRHDLRAPSALLRDYAQLLAEVRSRPDHDALGDPSPFPPPVASFLDEAERLFDVQRAERAADLLAACAASLHIATEYSRRAR